MNLDGLYFLHRFGQGKGVMDKGEKIIFLRTVCILRCLAFAWMNSFVWLQILNFTSLTISILGVSNFFYSIIMILRNRIHPHTIPIAQATLIPIKGKNSYFVNIPLSFPVYAMNGASSSTAITIHRPI